MLILPMAEDLLVLDWFRYLLQTESNLPNSSSKPDQLFGPSMGTPTSILARQLTPSEASNSVTPLHITPSSELLSMHKVSWLRFAITLKFCSRGCIGRGRLTQPVLGCQG